jgi:hypothetical protein
MKPIMRSILGRTSKTVPIGILVFVASIQFIWATTYYVSSTQGDDTNDGISISTPWKSTSRIYRCALGIGGNKLAPGDSVLLKTGDSFDGPIWLNASGSQPSPITIDRYGTGPNPIIYGDHPSATWSAVSNHAGIYSTPIWSAPNIQAVYDVNGTNYAPINRGTNGLDAWLSTFTPKNWGIDSGNVYIATTDGNAPPRMHLFEWSAFVFNGTNIICQNLDIRNSNIGFVDGNGWNTLRNCSVQDTISMSIMVESHAIFSEVCSNYCTRAGDTAIYFLGASNCWAHHNTIYQVGGPTQGQGMYVLGCYIPPGEMCGMGLQQGINNLMEFNTISNVYGSFFDYWLEVGSEVRFNYGFHSWGAAYPDGTGLKFHHNILNCDGGPGLGATHDYDPVKSPAPDAGPNLVYNNVLYGFTSYGLFSPAANSSNVVVRNNLIVAKTTNDIFVDINSGYNPDYNVYYCMAGAPKGWSWNNTRYSTLAAYQAASGQEAHSLYADPRFFSTNPVTAADFQIKATSPCVNAGQNLKTAGLLAPAQSYQDFLGILIPQGAGPDIGAYELPTPAPPTNLHKVP